MRSLLVACLVLLAAGVVGAQPAGKWLFGATGRGTARWRLFTARDDAFREAGKIGVWSKADSITEFEPPHYGDKP
jgi:hypothetical protein